MFGLDREEQNSLMGGSPAHGLVSVQHPDEIVNDRALTLEEKRAILAGFASDERTVIGRPTLRQLPSGAVVRLYEIKAALLALDRLERGGEPGGMRSRFASPARRRSIASWLSRRGGRPRDDDDPPPAPLGARLPDLAAA